MLTVIMTGDKVMVCALKKTALAALIGASVLLCPLSSSAKSLLLEVGTVEYVEQEHYRTHEETSIIVNESAKAEIEARKNGTYKAPEYGSADQGAPKAKSGTLKGFFKNMMK